MAATSARNLVNGTGTVTAAAGARLLVFSASQDFKQGATVVASGQKFTIDTGADKNWTTLQAVGSAISAASFTRSDTGTGRNRGTSGEIVPGAPHYLYRAPLDGAGSSDWYFYFDTLFWSAPLK